MEFEEFLAYVKGHVKEALPDTYRKASVTLKEVVKEGGRICHGILIRQEGETASPIVYLDLYYQAYKKGSGLAVILEDIAETVKEFLPLQKRAGDAWEDLKDFQRAKDKIIMEAVNAEKNREMLKDVPHARKEDLALVYKVLLNHPDMSLTSLIHNKQMEEWGIDAGKLKKLAEENGKRFFPARVFTPMEAVTNVLGEGEIPPDMMPEDMGILYFISNHTGNLGAAAVFYDETILPAIAEKFGTDLYLLPSSIHEMAVVPAAGGDLPGLKAMVKGINENCVPEEAWLSDNVYFYDAKTREISLADKRETDRKKEEGQTEENRKEKETKGPRRGR